MLTAPRCMVDELHRNGVREFEVHHCGKHPKLRFRWPGRMVTVTFSCTPSDTRFVDRKRVSQLRRLMREPNHA